MYDTSYLTDVTDEAVLGDYWPGIQLYYPPVKYAPALGVYEDIDQAAIRLRKHGHRTFAHTLLFDLEDGCRQKELSRETERSYTKLTVAEKMRLQFDNIVSDNKRAPRKSTVAGTKFK